MALRDLFLAGMSNAACTVNIISTNGVAGKHGATVSAMSSVSADTPLPTLLVCLNESSATAQAIKLNGVFCVNVLRDDQSDISDIFANRHPLQDGNKFSCASWTDDIHGCPKVEDGLVAFACNVSSWQMVGTHCVFFGAVQDVSMSPSGSPLIYTNRAYGSAVPIAPVSPRSSSRPTGVLGVGCFHTFGPYVVPRVLQAMSLEGTAPRLHLVEGDQRRIIDALNASEIDIALIYDMDLDDQLAVERLASLRPYVLLAEKHPLADKQAISLSDLLTWPLMLLDAPPSGDYFLSLFGKLGLEPDVGIRSSSFEMIRGLVAHGFGYSLLATKPACSMSYDGLALTSRPLVDPITPSHISLVTRKNADKSHVTTVFEQACRTLFAATKPFA